MSDVFAHPWLSGLFEAPGVAAALAPTRQLAHILTVERSYTRALHAASMISDDTATAVLSCLDTAKIDDSVLREGAARDGLIIPALIGALKADLPTEFHDGLHHGLTSQDVLDSAMSLTLQGILPILRDDLTDLQLGLTALRETHGTNLLMGRTRMQAALPMTVADRVNTWLMPLDTHLENLQRIGDDATALSLGGPVGLGLPAPIGTFMSADLGLALPAKAPHVMRDHLVALADWLSRVTGSLGKMGQDISLMSQQGLDDIVISGGGGSSAMPHKVNPIRAELLVTLAMFNATQVGGMHHAMLAEQERSGARWSLEWMLLPHMLQATSAGLIAAKRLVANITTMGDAP
ncbi:lyase family protein [Yoonia sp. SS1-5]|uniref:Lyase family protein n=1 Tax=Yoonia rhodophyticola TaxID=3137370 RepID=A0AAN0MET9_9RHOB